jgi:serine/threonine protein kinase/tetratricopeptide (TPR) repeat protein
MTDSLIGQHLSGRYRIDDFIGGGGMGQVYLGWDEHLRSPVGIKVILPTRIRSEGARREFQAEAVKLRKIIHHNVAQILDYGHEGDIDFLVMEYVPGVMLDQLVKAGPLPESEIVKLGSQLCDGMKAAHDRGIVHSDLKPANVRINEGGVLKILDFGIARYFDRSADATMTHEPEVARGTPYYMAPEQWDGMVDLRSDIYSAGALLFELATGRVPFKSDRMDVLRAQVQNADRPRPRGLNRALSEGLEQILLKCLERDPQDRYTSADELKQALQTIKAPFVKPPKPPKPPDPDPGNRRKKALAAAAAVALASIGIVAWMLFIPPPPPPVLPITRLAVLPFRNLTGKPENEYLSDGIADQLSTRVGQLDFEHLRVVGFPATSQYKNRPIVPAEVGKALGVGLMLDGSVMVNQTKVLINARLSDTQLGTQQWACQYAGALSDLFEVQGNVADSIARALEVKLVKKSGASQAPAPSDHGYDAFLRGRFELEKLTYEALMAARSDFESAAASDPGQAIFHAELARTDVLLENYGYVPASDAMPRALAAVNTALQIDPKLASGHEVLASIQQDYQRDWQGAEKTYQQAVQLDPSSATAHQSFASLLFMTGRLDSAKEQLNQALELSPLSLSILLDLGSYHYLTRDYARALERYDRACELHPDASIAHYQRGVTLLQLQKSADAIEAIAKAMSLEGASQAEIKGMRQAFAATGVQGYWRWRLARLTRLAQSVDVSPYQLARAFAAVGETEHAFQFLELSAQRRESALAGVTVDPTFEALRKNPQYKVVLGYLKLPAAPEGVAARVAG